MPTQRNIMDAALHVEKYLPAAAATNYTDSVDLGSAAPGLVGEKAELKVVVPALPNHTDDTKDITLTLQDSADDVTFADVAPLHRCVVPGVASTGSSATEFRIRPPSTIRRYIRLAQAVPAGDGDCTGGLVTLDPVF